MRNKNSFFPGNIRKVLNESWGKDTCWPNVWNPKNPAAGHCRVTAAVIHALFGGEILFAIIKKKPLYTHYWNRLTDGREYDFTASQFKKNIAIPRGGKISTREVMDAEPIKKSYPILLRKVKVRLNIA